MSSINTPWLHTASQEKIWSLGVERIDSGDFVNPFWDHVPCVISWFCNGWLLSVESKVSLIVQVVSTLPSLPWNFPTATFMTASFVKIFEAILDPADLDVSSARAKKSPISFRASTETNVGSQLGFAMASVMMRRINISQRLQKVWVRKKGSRN